MLSFILFAYKTTIMNNVLFYFFVFVFSYPCKMDILLNRSKHKMRSQREWKLFNRMWQRHLMRKDVVLFLPHTTIFNKNKMKRNRKSKATNRRDCISCWVVKRWENKTLETWKSESNKSKKKRIQFCWIVEHNVLWYTYLKSSMDAHVAHIVRDSKFESFN